MSVEKRKAGDAGELRRRAEEAARRNAGYPPREGGALSAEEMQQTLHELRVHQIELEMQNEELRRTHGELDAALARYFDLYELAPVGYCTVSEQGLILEANLTAATLLGVPRGELIKAPFSRFILNEDQDVHYLHCKSLFGTGESQAYGLRMVKGDGTSFWARLEVAAAQDTDGEPACRIVLSDNTERKRIEGFMAFLAQTRGGIQDEPFFEALARNLAQSLGMDFVCIDRLEGDGLTARTLSVWYDGKFEDNVTYALKDTPCGDVVGRELCCYPASVCQFFPRDQVLRDLKAESYVGVTLWGCSGLPIGLIAVIGRKPLVNRPLAEAILKVVAGRAAGELERLDAEAALQRAHDELEERVAERTADLQRVNLELTEKIEENARSLVALHRSRKALAEAQRIAHLGNWDWNVATDQLDWSDEMYRIFGYTPQAFSLDFEGFLDRVHPEDRATVQECVDRALLGVEGLRLRCRIVMPDKEERVVKVRGEVTFDKKCVPIRMFGTLLDITDLDRAYEEVRVRQQQLVQADKLASLGMLSAGMAHEINNPNHSILSNAEVLSGVWESIQPILDRFFDDFGEFVLGGLEYSEARDKLPAMFSSIVDSSRRIATIVGELRSFARNDSEEHSAEVDVNMAVNSALVLMSKLVKKHTDKFSAELAPGLPTLSGNYQHIEQVVINLLHNACQALPSRDRAVTVVTYHDEPSDSVVIEVRDEGVGIPEENLKLVGKPFFTTKPGSEGTGLGLWISSNIAQKHGGALTFAPGQGGGTCAVLTLPTHGRAVPAKAME
jgi:PAS domain S-box-containing protein